MSEDNTQRTRQIFYALRFEELVGQAKATLELLDERVLDEREIVRCEKLMAVLNERAHRVAKSTYKLLD